MYFHDTVFPSSLSFFPNISEAPISHARNIKVHKTKPLTAKSSRWNAGEPGRSKIKHELGRDVGMKVVLWDTKVGEVLFLKGTHQVEQVQESALSMGNMF